MKNLTRARECREWTRMELGFRAHIHPSRIGSFELGRIVPYPVELGRIAAALQWDGDPQALLEEVDGHGA